MTISYNRLGSNGRLGNQMFQYAGFRGLASNRNFDWLIPPEDSESTCNYGLFDCFKMTTVSEDNKGYLGVNYSGVVPYLVEAIKDLKQELEAIKRQL